MGSHAHRNFTMKIDYKKMESTRKLLFAGRAALSNILISSVLIFFSVLLAFPTFAQDRNDSSGMAGDAMNQWLDYSRPGRYHQVLADLAGTWDFRGRHFSGNPNPDSNKVEIEFSGTAVRTPFANGRFFIVQTVSGQGQIIQSPIQDGKFIDDNARGIETEGYDNVKKKYVHTLIGNNLGSNILYFEGDYDPMTKTISSEYYSEWAPGMKWKVHYYFIIQDKDHYKIEIYGEREGKIIKDTELNYTRVKG
jgi:hypothetical protein